MLFVSFALPSFAVFNEPFYDINNLLPNPTSNVVTSGTVITDDGSYDGCYLTKIDLDSNKDYTFISSKGSDRLLIAYKTLLGDGSSVFYTTNEYSKNLLNTFAYNSAYNGLTISGDEMGRIVVNGLKYGGNRVTLISNVTLAPGTYTFSYDYVCGVFDHPSLELPDIHIGFEFPSMSDVVLGMDSVGSKSVTFTLDSFQTANLLFVIGNDNVSFTNFTFELQIERGSTATSYKPYHCDPLVWNDGSVSYVTFNSGIVRYDVYIGVKDPTEPLAADLYLSTLTSDSNYFYLLEGFYSYDDIYNLIGSDKYQSGFDVGYKQGETDGLNANSFFKSLIYSVFSGPFIFMSNAFNFEIFGINIYQLLTIFLTLMLVSFVIKCFKKGF